MRGQDGGATRRPVCFDLASKRLDRMNLAGKRGRIQHDAARTAPGHAGILGCRPVPRPHWDFHERQVKLASYSGHGPADRLVVGMAIETPGSKHNVTRFEVRFQRFCQFRLERFSAAVWKVQSHQRNMPHVQTL